MFWFIGWSKEVVFGGKNIKVMDCIFFILGCVGYLLINKRIFWCFFLNFLFRRWIEFLNILLFIYVCEFV